MPSLDDVYYLGADPGESGGIALINDDGHAVFAEKVPPTAKELLNYLRMLTTEMNIVGSAIERIDPRPTGYKDRSGKFISTILRSSCIIYGDFLQLHMAMIACGLNPLIPGPRDWQKALGVETRDKGESKSQFKRRLKALAEQTFLDIRVTLKTADALLIAEYARRKNNA